MLSVVVFLGGQMLSVAIFGPPPQRAAEQKDKDKDNEQDGAPDVDADGAPTGEPKKDAAEPADGQETTQQDAAAPRKDPDGAPDAAANDKPAPAGEIAAADPRVVTAAPEWFTLANDRVQAVFTNQGAAIERLELIERTRNDNFRYLNLDDHSGYLGYLALTDEAPAGCRIQVVPPGSPAARATAKDRGVPAGLQVGDTLLQLGATAIRSRADAGAALEHMEPGDTVEIEVARGQGESRQILKFDAVLSQRPLALISSESPYANGPGPNPPSFQTRLGRAASRPAGEVSLTDPGLAQLPWEIAKKTADLVEFRLRMNTTGGEDAHVEFVKRYQLAAVDEPQSATAGYHLTYEFEVHNHSGAQQTVAYETLGPNGLPVEGWWYLNKIHPSFGSTAGARDVVLDALGWGFQIRSAHQIYKQAQDEVPEKPFFTANQPAEERKLRFIGVETQYFSVAMLPVDYADGGTMLMDEVIAYPVGGVDGLPSARSRLANSSFRTISELATIEDGGQLSDRFVIFAGPKKPDVLEAYALGETLYYGWFPWVAKPLSKLLHFFYAIVRNYGLAIILLTVLVRACMWPLSRKAARNAAVMQELAPELKRIAEKYKSDMEKRIQAQRELYAKYNFNPFGGCLLMFVQLPIFIGLYRCLSVDIELRQAPLIPGLEWCSNLAGPDMLWRWPLPFFASETGWLGPYLNLLPVITIVLFIVQQKMFTPPATDDNTRMQQKLMQFMMIFIGIMFFKVPSGLCIYFIASSLWGIGERVLIPKPTATGGASAAGGGGSRKATPPSGNGAGGGRSRKPSKKK
jgi:YidC/Oxa1 family membrane protein insertase